MKRMICLVLMMVSSFILTAQGYYDLRFMANESKINLQIDYSEASILGVDFNDWVQGEPDWDKSFIEIRNKFLRAFNEQTDKGRHPHRAGTYPDANYTLKIQVVKVKDSGSEIHANIFIVAKNGSEVFLDKMKGEQGRFGSVANLMGDAMEDLGERLGKTIKVSAR